MAVKYAVANGNWSAGATWNGGTVPVTGDDVYSNNFRVTIDVATVDAAFLTNASLASPAINAGGGFTTNANCTISANINQANATNVVANKLLIISNSTTTNLSGTINHGTTTSATTAPIVEVLAGSTLNYTGGTIINAGTSTTLVFYFIDCYGIANINSNITSFNGLLSSAYMIIVRNGSQVNVTGNITHRNGQSSGYIFLQSGGSTLNLIGNITFNTAGSAISATTAPDPSNDLICNFTGNVIHNIGAGSNQYIFTNSSLDNRFICTLIINTFTRISSSGIQIGIQRGTLNITTNALFGDNFGGTLYVIGSGTNSIINFTGNLKGSHVGTGTRALEVSSTPINLTLNIYGNIEGGDSTSSNAASAPSSVNYGVEILNSTAILDGNIVVIGSSLSENPGLFARTSPNVFIKRAVTGAAPFYTAPYQGYVRFKTTAPEFQVSKQDNTLATLSDPALQDYPSINNVRQGITYGFLSYTGNLIVPPSGNVSLNTNYDSNGSITGSAILTPQDFFTAISQSSDPVATRLKNVSTVQTTGDQLQGAFNA